MKFFIDWDKGDNTSGSVCVSLCRRVVDIKDLLAECRVFVSKWPSNIYNGWVVLCTKCHRISSVISLGLEGGPDLKIGQSLIR